MTPYPDPRDYKTFYDKDYYETQKMIGLSYPDEKQQLSPCYANISQRFLSYGITDRLLDIGCGTGEFLVSVQEHGIKGEGVEPSSYAAKIAREKGLSVTHGLLSDVATNTKLYAAAHCSHVLEHVPDAHTFLNQMREILEPGAPLYIEVPIQFDGVLDRINRLRGQQRNFSDFSIHHHYFFTPSAISQLLHMHDFEVLSLTTFLTCRRMQRGAGLRKWAIQSLLWLADRLGQRGDVISVWARRGK